MKLELLEVSEMWILDYGIRKALSVGYVLHELMRSINVIL